MALNVLCNVDCILINLKTLVAYIVALVTIPLSGQSLFQQDAINIGEVVISSNRGKEEAAGYKKSTFDSTSLKLNSQISLAELLPRYSPVFIKSYGMGGSASPSLRGTGAGHTQLTWNGINIGNPMLGQCDLSLFPSGLVDNIQIYYGGASMATGTGGIGGIVNLETVPVWKKQTLVSVSPGIGSFGQYTGLVRVRTGSSKFQTVTKAFFQSSENNYPFINTWISSDPVRQRRTNSQVRQDGFMQEVYLRHDRSVASARIWYESAGRNLPSSVLVQQPGLKETQQDESLRTMITYDHFGNADNISVSGAWIKNRLDYANSLASIDSRNSSGTVVFRAALDHDKRKGIRLKATLEESLNMISSNNYDGNVSRNNLSLALQAGINEGNQFSSSLLVRETADEGNLLVPDFSAGLQYRLIPGREYFLKANVSRNSKLPSLNDLYWLPGGNPDLKNEYAYMYEITGEMTGKISALLTLSVNLSGYLNNIRDMIQWQPGEYSYWTAGNIKSVNTSGLESSAYLEYVSGRVDLGLHMNYSLTRATAADSGSPDDNSAGKQLVYIPKHQANCSLIANYGKFYSSWILTMNSRRYLTVENTSYLPAYVLNDLIAGIKMNPKSLTVDFCFQVDNLFNVSYQTVAFYPLPGRTYSAKLVFQILK